MFSQPLPKKYIFKCNKGTFHETSASQLGEAEHQILSHIPRPTQTKDWKERVAQILRKNLRGVSSVKWGVRRSSESHTGTGERILKRCGFSGWTVTSADTLECFKLVCGDVREKIPSRERLYIFDTKGRYVYLYLYKWAKMSGNPAETTATITALFKKISIR